MIMLKDDKSNSEHDEMGNVFTNPQLALVNKIFPPKWFTKVKIVVSPDYHFVVIAMIDSGADMNCI